MRVVTGREGEGSEGEELRALECLQPAEAVSEERVGIGLRRGGRARRGRGRRDSEVDGCREGGVGEGEWGVLILTLGEGEEVDLDEVVVFCFRRYRQYASC
jgi:hypothetical protein